MNERKEHPGDDRQPPDPRGGFDRSQPDPAIPTVPVICDRCRATGFAGDEAFSAIPDILNFTPVQRRAHVNGWREEHQRAFIAALAITGSPRQAARAIGRHAFGAEQLRNHRGGKGFAAAWDAALELARERETHRIHDNLAELSEQRETELARISPPRGEGLGEGLSRVRPIHPEHDDDPDIDPPGFDPEFDSGERREYLRTKQRIRERFLGARRIFLAIIAKEPAKRAAWEALCGPTDWDLAAGFEAQPTEPPHANIHQPDMQLLGENGLIADFVGGEDKMAPIRRQLLEIEPIAEE